MIVIMMASQVFEQEPDYMNHVNFDNIVDPSLLESTLDSVANQVKLGDLYLVDF